MGLGLSGIPTSNLWITSSQNVAHGVLFLLSFSFLVAFSVLMTVM